LVGPTDYDGLLEISPDGTYTTLVPAQPGQLMIVGVLRDHPSMPMRAYESLLVDDNGAPLIIDITAGEVVDASAFTLGFMPAAQ